MKFEQIPQQIPEAPPPPNTPEEVSEINLTEVYKAFGISEEDEEKFHNNTDNETLSEAVKISLERSFSNMRKWLEIFLKDPEQRETKELILDRIHSEVRNITEQFSLGYNSSIENAIKILEGQIETGNDVLSNTGLEKNDIDAMGMYNRASSRGHHEPLLGWKPNEIITMSVDDPVDIQHGGSSRDWGEVHFQFNIPASLKESTYTVGDSMSPRKGHSPFDSVDEREIAYVHLPLAKALHNLSFEFLKGSSQRESGYYIEAQVPKHYLEANNGLQKLIIDRKRLLELAKKSYQGIETPEFYREVFRLEYGVTRDEVEFIGTPLIDTKIVLKKDANNPDAQEVKPKRQLTDEEKNKVRDSIADKQVDEQLRPLISLAQSKNIEVVMI